MTEDTWKRLAAQYELFPDAAAGPATPEEIQTAEREIGLPFAEDFREFLLRYGGAYVGWCEIYGIREPALFRSDTDKTKNQLVMMQSFYKRGFPGIGEWVIIADDGRGNPIGIAPDGTVQRIDHDCGMEVDTLAVTFEQFIREKCLEIAP